MRHQEQGQKSHSQCAFQASQAVLEFCQAFKQEMFVEKTEWIYVFNGSKDQIIDIAVKY